MNFTTYGAESVHIALTTGHTAIVPTNIEKPEGVPLDVQFRREAIARGCVPVGVNVEETPSEPSFDRRKVIKDAIHQMLDSDEENAFTNDGKPDLRKLNAIVGFQVDRSERDAIWSEFEAA